MDAVWTFLRRTFAGREDLAASLLGLTGWLRRSIDQLTVASVGVVAGAERAVRGVERAVVVGESVHIASDQLTVPPVQSHGHGEMLSGVTT